MRKVFIVSACFFYSFLYLFSVSSFATWKLQSSTCVAESFWEATDCFYGGGSGVGFNWTNEGDTTICDEGYKNYEIWLEIPVWCSGYVDERNPAWADDDRYKSIGTVNYSSFFWCPSLTCTDYGSNACGIPVEGEQRGHLEDCVCPFESRICMGEPTEETGLCCENLDESNCPNPLIGSFVAGQEHFCEVADCEGYCGITCTSDEECMISDCTCSCLSGFHPCGECEVWNQVLCSCQPVDGCIPGGGGGGEDVVNYTYSCIQREVYISVNTVTVSGYLQKFVVDEACLSYCMGNGGIEANCLMECGVLESLGPVADSFLIDFSLYDAGHYRLLWGANSEKMYDFIYPCTILNICGNLDVSCLDSNISELNMKFPFQALTVIKDSLWSIKDIQPVVPVIPIVVHGFEQDISLDLGDMSVYRKIQFAGILLGVSMFIIRKIL